MKKVYHKHSTVSLTSKLSWRSWEYKEAEALEKHPRDEMMANSVLQFGSDTKLPRPSETNSYICSSVEPVK